MASRWSLSSVLARRRESGEAAPRASPPRHLPASAHTRLPEKGSPRPPPTLLGHTGGPPRQGPSALPARARRGSVHRAGILGHPGGVAQALPSPVTVRPRKASGSTLGWAKMAGGPRRSSVLRMGWAPRSSGSVRLGLCTGRQQEAARSRARRWLGQPLPRCPPGKTRPGGCEPKGPALSLEEASQHNTWATLCQSATQGAGWGPRARGASPCRRGPGAPIHQAGLSAPSRAGVWSAAGEGPELWQSPPPSPVGQR